MKGKENIAENRDLFSIYIKSERYHINREENRPDVWRREDTFVDSHEQLSEDFCNLMQKISLKELMDRLERNILISALIKFYGNQRRTAEFLGVKPTTLYEKIKKHNISIGKIPCVD